MHTNSVVSRREFYVFVLDAAYPFFLASPIALVSNSGRNAGSRNFDTFVHYLDKVNSVMSVSTIPFLS